MQAQPKENPGDSRKRRRFRAEPSTLKPFLLELLRQYHSSHWISSDPIQYAHRYSKPDDREIAAFVAACFAYGSVKTIHQSVSRVLEPMGESPAAFVRGFDGVSRWPGFYHRFHREGHVVVLIKILKRALAEHGSIGGLFRAQAATAEGDGQCERVLNGAAEWLRRVAAEEVEALRDATLGRGMRFFFNAPSDGSACKRMVMFLRWMSRSDDVDLGLWDWFDPRELIVPADTHVARIAFYIGLRGGRENAAPNWRMAREITESLRRVRPEDPVAFDFAIARLGILDLCKRQYRKSICERCPVAPCCRFSQVARCA